MQDARRRNIVGLQRVEHEAEGARVGLVGADLVGGEHVIERDHHEVQRALETRAVYVRQHAQPVAPAQRMQRPRAVGKGRPLADGRPERGALFRRRRRAALARHSLHDLRQNLRIGEVRLRLLDSGFVAGEGGEQRLVAGAGPRRLRQARTPRPEGVRQPGLPVDQRAVTVERQDLEIKVAHGHPPPAPAKARKLSKSARSTMTRGALFWPPSLPRRFIHAANPPGASAVTRGASRPNPPARWAS